MSNIFYQNSFELIKNDIENEKLPRAILLSGNVFSGKFTAAMEIARLLSCSGTKSEDCECENCKRHKEFKNANILVAGNRDCLLEIKAMKDALIQGWSCNDFVCSVRKLTLRFSETLWAESDKFSKIAPLIESIESDLLGLSSLVTDSEKLEKKCSDIIKNCEKLDSFLYESIPIDQIRGASSWLRIKATNGKKVFIIENAEKMLDAARNALLKILEEPPSDAVFILTTSKRGAIMQTILSRVRVYNFTERSAIEQKEILEKVFHNNQFNKIQDFLYSLLPLTSAELRSVAIRYYDSIKKGQIPSAESIIKSCSSFEPKILFKMFLENLMEVNSDFSNSAFYSVLAEKNLKSIQECFNNVSIFNQSTLSAIERLTRDLSLNLKLMR